MKTQVEKETRLLCMYRVVPQKATNTSVTRALHIYFQDLLDLLSSPFTHAKQW